MEFALIQSQGHGQGDLAALATDCLIIGSSASRIAPLSSLPEATQNYLKALHDAGDIHTKIGETSILFNVPGLAAKRVLIVGYGDEDLLSATQYQKVLTSALQALKKTGAQEATSALTLLKVKGHGTDWQIRQLIEAAGACFYSFQLFKSKKHTDNGSNNGPKLQKLNCLLPGNAMMEANHKALREAQAIANGMEFTRNLGNSPANICTPTYLAEQAKQLAADFSNLKVNILDRQAIADLGMNSFLAVSQGSLQPPKLIVIEYQGTQNDAKPIALIGKGITFDSGGISIKPSEAMDEMKYDMQGAGTVLGVMRAVAELKLPINLVCVIPTCENLPDGGAVKPGDIVTTMSGQTVEILNTDAEGRLILCDALTYVGRYQPETVIDIATLTGAIVIGLGRQLTGLFSNQQELADDLLKASHESSDYAWHMPLWEEYQEILDSNFADMANVGNREGGSITAACFLARFTRQYKWAHLDIAGTAWRSGKAKGATGRPVPMVVQFLLNKCRNSNKDG